MNAINRFLKYIKFDTKSDPNSKTFPSTLKQKDLAQHLYNELKELGIETILNDFGYVYGFLKANKENITPIGFISHMDTSFDASGKNIRPRIIKNYDGNNIKLNNNLIMTKNEFESLNEVLGDDIVVTDGTTLLGADDKAGISEIITAIETVIKSNIPHGDIYICFTPDEEIGRGTDYFNKDLFKASFAFTVDGSSASSIEYENFNAASIIVTIKGKSIHPGSAKNKMINSINLGHQFHNEIPPLMRPEHTSGYEGFNHLNDISGTVEKTVLKYIIRNHNKNEFQKQKETFKTATKKLNTIYGPNTISLKITDNYSNMYEILKDKMEIINIAKKAILNVGLTPKIEPIRGGTDGARLTFMGLPCPNLGTGGYNFHGPFEFLSINQMNKSTNIIIEIIKIVSESSNI